MIRYDILKWIVTSYTRCCTQALFVGYSCPAIIPSHFAAVFFPLEHVFFWVGNPLRCKPQVEFQAPLHRMGWWDASACFVQAPAFSNARASMEVYWRCRRWGSIFRWLFYNFFCNKKMFICSGGNLKHPFLNGCFSWMIPNLYMGNGCLNKHLFKTGCLEFQV